MRPLGQENDKAFRFAERPRRDRSESKRFSTYRVADLVLGPGQDGKTIQPEGLKASAMNEQQRDHAARSDFGMGEHRSRKRGRSPHRRDQSRVLARLGSPGAARRPFLRDATVQPITGFRGRSSLSSMRPRSWAAIRRCISTPSTAIRRMTTAGSGHRQNEDGILAAAGCDSAVARNACLSRTGSTSTCEATMISVQKGSVQAQIRLTPGRGRISHRARRASIPITDGAHLRGRDSELTPMTGAPVIISLTIDRRAFKTASG